MSGLVLLSSLTPWSVYHINSARLHFPTVTWSFWLFTQAMFAAGGFLSWDSLLWAFSFAVYHRLGLAIIRRYGMKQWFPWFLRQVGLRNGRTKQRTGGAVQSVEMDCGEWVVSSLTLLPWCWAVRIVCYRSYKCAQIGHVHLVKWKEAEEAG